MAARMWREELELFQKYLFGYLNHGLTLGFRGTLAGHMATTVAHAAAESSSDGKEASNKDTERRKMRLWDDKSDIQHGNRKRKKCTPYDLVGLRLPVVVVLCCVNFQADFLAENRSNTGYKLRETVDEFLDRSGELFFAKRDSRDQLWQELESGFERARLKPKADVHFPNVRTYVMAIHCQHLSTL
eukprot:266134-Amorphochlora_amoeboformis.AAC.3